MTNRKEKELSIERLKELLVYSSETGLFFWRTKPNKNIIIGSIAGGLSPHGYITIGIDGYVYYAHRLAWYYYYGAWPVEDIDHDNRIRSDNRISNLNPSNIPTNGKNRKKNSNNKTGHTGVVKAKGNKWCAQIKVNGAKVFLGHHDTLEEAIKARQKAEEFYKFHIGHGT